MENGLPPWEGPFQVSQILKGGTCLLHDLDDEMHNYSINDKFSKAWYPATWEMMDINSYFHKN